MCYTIARGNCRQEINEKDMAHLLRLVRADLRYLRGRNRRRGGADDKKLEKRGELERKLAQIARKR